MKRAVITGSDIAPSIDNNQQEVLTSLCGGRSGITFFQEFKDPRMRSHVQGNVKLSITDLIGRKVVRSMSDASIYICLSMEQAVVNAGLAPEAHQSNSRIGLIAGFGGGPLKFQVFGADTMRSLRDLKAADPYVVTKAMVSGVSAHLATPFKIYGVNRSINSACATSTHCIGNAIEQVQPGKQDIAFINGGEEPCQETACEFDIMGILSTKYNDTPEKAPHAYDVNHDGFVTVDGDGMVVVEGLEHALARGVHIYVEIVDYGATSDGTGMIAPSGEGAVCCMQTVIHGVDIPIDYLNSHGTSTLVGSMKELGATREVFGGNSPVILATKAMTSHSLGAASVQEAIYPLLMLGHGFTVLGINVEELDGQAVGLSIVVKPTNAKLITVMSNSFDFGGTNAMLVTCEYNA